MRPQAPHFVSSLPPEGAQASLGAARREALPPQAPHFMSSLPPEGAQACLEAAPREA
jgi:hypothetical protein